MKGHNIIPYERRQSRLRGDYGVVFGSFAPLHIGHLRVIEIAKKENPGGVLVIVCGESNDKGGPRLPLEKRFKYTKEYFKDDNKVFVCMINSSRLGIEGYSFDGWIPWLKELDENIIPEAIEEPAACKARWYTGEQLYYNDLSKLGRDMTLIDRSFIPISATMIRLNPEKHWHDMAWPFRKAFVKEN